MEGRLTVQMYEFDADMRPRQRGENETEVSCVIVSLGDQSVQIEWDEDNSRWEIESSGVVDLLAH